jgi:SAM-dependent methyltransferase
MAPLGWRCFGCDVSETALGIARSRIPQAQLFNGGVESLPFAAGSFEAVTLWHTLEHLENPRRALERIYQMLAPRGRLIVALPNAQSMEARLFGRRWIEVDIPGHLFFFSIRNLKALLEVSGFRLVRVRPQVHPSTVSDSVGFLLDDLFGLQESRSRPALYRALFPIAAFSCAVGNWGCIEVTAQRP